MTSMHVSQQRPVLVIGLALQNFHKVSCKVSQQRPDLVKGHVTTKVSQIKLQSLAAKAFSCHRACHRKSFTKLVLVIGHITGKVSQC